MSEKESKMIPKEWTVTCNRFVGMIDIMGFKDLVSRNSHEKVYKMMLKVSEAMTNTQFWYGTDFDKNDNPLEKVIFMTYSDSIIVYSQNNSAECADMFIGCMSGLSEELFKNGVPHKGSVAFGKMTVDFDNAIFFGQPLIDAYLIQDELQFYGTVAHSTAEFNKNFKNDDNVIEYNCPFKTGTANHLTITPGSFITKDPIDIKEIEKLTKSIQKLKINTSGGLRNYIDNTLKYIEYSKNYWLERNRKDEIEREKIKIDDNDFPF